MSATAMAEVESPIAIEALSTAERATGLQVTNLAQRSIAAEMGRIVAGLCKEAEEFFKPMKQAAQKTHKEICTKENSIIQPLEAAKAHLSREIGAFDQRMERERLAEEQRLQEEARLEAEAEAKRLSEDIAIEDALGLQADGDLAGAMAVLNNPAPLPVFVPPVVLRREVPKTAGVSVQQIWRYKITNADAIPREYLMVDEKKLAAIVKAMKGVGSIPGVQMYPEGAARFTA